MVDGDLRNYVTRGYHPRVDVAPAVRHWAGELALTAGPTSEVDGRRLVACLCNYWIWLTPRGFSIDDSASEVLSDDLIAQFTLQTVAEGTRPTVTSMLRRVRRAAVGERKVRVVVPRTDVDSAVSPVGDHDIAGFLRWVDGHDRASTRYRDGRLLVALLRGAGCTKSDLDHLDTAMWTAPTSTRIHVTITANPWDRTIEVTGPFARILIAAKAAIPSGNPFDYEGTGRSGRAALKSLENAYYKQRATYAKAGVARSLPPFINADRYRVAWLVERLNAGVRLDVLLHEAGLVSAAALDRYLQFLPDSVAPKKPTTAQRAR